MGFGGSAPTAKTTQKNHVNVLSLHSTRKRALVNHFEFSLSTDGIRESFTEILVSAEP
jgi:hypothetical protein